MPVCLDRMPAALQCASGLGAAPLPPLLARYSVARVTVEDCLEKVPNRFALVILASERARQLARGGEATVECDNKPAVTALREIAQGTVAFREDVKNVITDYIEERRRSGFM